MPVTQRRNLDVGDIYINQVRHTTCGWYIRSRNRHDFRSYKCGELSIDSSSWYTKLVGDVENAEHGDQASELYSFTSTGTITLDPLVSEIVGNIAATKDETQRDQLNLLARYVTDNKDRGPQEGWPDLWLSPPEGVPWREAGDDNCPACGQHFSGPHSPACPLNNDEPENTPTSAYVELFGDDPATVEQFGQRYFAAFDSLSAYAEHTSSERPAVCVRFTKRRYRKTCAPTSAWTTQRSVRPGLCVETS